MADETVEEEIDPEDIEGGFDVEEAPEDLDEDDEIDPDIDAAFVEPDVDDDAVVVVEEDEDAAIEVPVAKPKRDDEDGEEDDEEELDPDDVEADLDMILKDRIAAAPEEEEEEEEEAVEADQSGEAGGGRIQPRRPGEFVCQSCFLLKHPSQLADKKRQLCNDCV